MAAAFDAVGPASTATNGTTSPLTWTHVVAAGGTHLLVYATWDNTPDTSATMSCTYNGVAMTSLGVRHTGGGTAGFLQAWSLDLAGGLATGSHTVSLTFSGAGPVDAGSLSV